MGSLRITFCTALTLAALACAPPAHAADGGDLSVTPSAPAPGTDVALRVGGCSTGRTGTAVSPAFVADVRLTGADGTLVGESRVRSTLTAGTYAVKVSCGETERAGTITVAAKGARPAAPASPVAPVPAGGGGAARFTASDARAAGPGAAHTVTGLILAGAAATAVALRSARRSRERS